MRYKMTLSHLRTFIDICILMVSSTDFFLDLFNFIRYDNRKCKGRMLVLSIPLLVTVFCGCTFSKV